MLTMKPGLHRWRTRALTTSVVGAVLLLGAPMLMAHADLPATVPAGTVALNDGGDGYTNAAEAQSNKPTVAWTAATNAPAGTTATVWFAPLSGSGDSPGAACGPWAGQPATSPTNSTPGYLTPACANLLPEGGFGFNVRWVSGTDISSKVTKTSTMDRVVNAPVITPDSTVHPLTPAGLVVNGTGDADLAGVTAYTPLKNPKAGVVSGSTWSATYSSSFTAGKHSFVATATDLAGNMSGVSAPQIIRFSASAVAPVAPVVLSPDNGADIAANVVFTGTAPVGTVVVLTTPIGSPPVTTELGRSAVDANGNWTLGVNGLGGGLRAFKFVAIDEVDRLSGETTRSHFVDTVKPIIAITQNASSLYTSGEVTLSGNAIDDRTLVSRVVVQLKNTVTGQLAAPMNATRTLVPESGSPEDVGYVPAYWTWTIQFTPPVGAWSGQVFALDAAGNVSNPATMTTFVSAVPPSGP